KLNDDLIMLSFHHRDIRTVGGKIKRVMLQFSPGSWTRVRWLDPKCGYSRFFTVWILVVSWQISELNTFFLKHIFPMPPDNVIVVSRLILICFIVAPSLRLVFWHTFL